MFGLSSVPWRSTAASYSSSNVACSVRVVTSQQTSSELSASISTSGSTIGHEPGLLAERRVARERVRVRADVPVGRDAVADRDHGPPLREARAELAVLLEPPAQPVEALGDLLAREERVVVRAGVDLDPGDHALRREHLGERRAVVRALADRLVVEDHAADGVLHPRRREEQLAVEAAVLLRRLDADRVEPLLDRPRALVRREDALVVGDDRAGGVVEWDGISVLLSSSSGSEPS